MTRKCHDHTLQTNPRHCEEEAKHDIQKTTNVKQPALSHPAEWLQKIERTQNTAQQNKGLIQKKHKQLEQH